MAPESSPITFQGGSGPNKPAKEQNKPARQMTYAEWRANINNPRAAGSKDGITSLSHTTLEGFIKWLNRDLQKKDPAGTEDGAGNGGREKGPGPSNPDKEPTAPTPPNKLKLLPTDRAEYGHEGEANNTVNRNHLLMQALIEQISKKLSVDATAATTPLIVEIAGTALLKQAIALYSTNGGAAEEGLPTPTMQMWLSRFASFAYTQDVRELLLPYFSAIACCTVHLNRNATLQSLKESLLRLIARPLVAGELAICADNAMQTNRFARFSAVQRNAMLAHAKNIEAVTTESEELGRLIAHTLAPDTIRRPAVRKGLETAFNELWRLRNNKKPPFGVLKDPPDRLACPSCQSRIHLNDLPTLRAERVLLCTNIVCQRPIFFALDTAQLEQLGLSGRFKE
jgi:hypothetical protein